MSMSASAKQETALDQSQSIRVIRNLMRLAMSNISYARQLFPEGDFVNVEVAPASPPSTVPGPQNQRTQPHPPDKQCGE